MIPTWILLGLIAGGWFGHRRPKALLIVAVATSVLWGLMVGIGSSDADVFVGGTALAFANYAVGALFGVGIRALLSLGRGTTRSSQGGAAKTFNFVSAVLTATALALGTFQLMLSAAGAASGWALAGSWVLSAVVWAVVYSLVRDGIRPTLALLARSGRQSTSD